MRRPMGSRPLTAWTVLGTLVFLLPGSASFITRATPRHARVSQTSLCAGWFDEFQSFFDAFWNPNKGTSDDNRDDQTMSANTDPYRMDESDNTPAGTTRILHVPVKTIKPGGLRLFIMFYLLGKQKSPEGERLWTAHQPTSASDEFVIEYFFHDGSAMLTLELTQDDGVTVDRVGSVPSTAYMIHESSILDGILDELQVMAFDESISLENRLLTLPEPQNAIDKARELIAFG